MILKRRAAAVFALLLALFFALGSVAASQAVAATPASKPVLSKPVAPVPVFNGEDGEDEEDEGEDHENELHHDQLREQYGEVEQVFLPPLVVTNPAGAANQLAPASGGGLLDSANIDPHENMPIDPKTIGADRKTPADSFFQMASVAISTMAAGSIALGGFAIRRSVRMKNSPDSDFIYK